MRLEFSQYATPHIDYRYVDYAQSFNKLFFKYYLGSYVDHYNGERGNELIYGKYISSGVEGLESFAEFLRGQGYNTAKAYYLTPNSLILQNGSTATIEMKSITGVFSLSFGIEIADDDPALVEFKLKNM